MCMGQTARGTFSVAPGVFGPGSQNQQGDGCPVPATSALPFSTQKRKRRLRVAPCPQHGRGRPRTETEVSAVYLAAPRSSLWRAGGEAAGLPCPRIPGERSVLCSLIPLATWLGSSMEGPGRASPGWGRDFLPPDSWSLSTARERGRGFLRQRHISLWGECASTGAEAPAPLARHRWRALCADANALPAGGGPQPVASLPHSPPIHAPGRQGRWGRCGPAARGGSALGRLDTLPHAAPDRLVSWQRHVGTALDSPARHPCSSGVFPPLSPFHRGQIRLQEVKQACPELPAHSQSYHVARYCCAGLGGHRGRTEAQGPSPCTPLPLHQECVVHALPVPTPDLTPAGLAGAESLSSHTHTQL